MTQFVLQQYGLCTVQHKCLEITCGKVGAACVGGVISALLCCVYLSELVLLSLIGIKCVHVQPKLF